VKLLGWQVPFTKQTDQNTVTPIGEPLRLSSAMGWIVEAFGGMWSRNLVLDNTGTLLANSAVYACVSLISGDIAKMRIKLLRRQGNFWPELTEDDQSPFLKVLRIPNRYQTWYQFVEQWLISKLIWGNTYVLKERDSRGVVRAMYVLNPQSVYPLVAPDGDVFYRMGKWDLAGLEDAVTAPASEMIHDRAKCLMHPLVGVPPLYAAAMSGTQGKSIQTNSSVFFNNMSRPSGQLTAPGHIDDETALRIKETFERNFSGSNMGKIMVAGDGLKFETFSIPAEQSQLIEQLKYTVEDVARPFHVPLYKIGAGPVPSLGSVGALNQEYYQQALQPHIESIESLLDVGLELPNDLDVSFDVDALMRLDPKGRMEAAEIGVRSAILKPDEARAAEGKPPVPGGNSCYMQQQNYSLEALAKRDAQDNPFSPATAVPPPPEAEDDESEDEEMTEEQTRSFLKRFGEDLRCAA
jgi:HK97 family phage portal protein